MLVPHGVLVRAFTEVYVLAIIPLLIMSFLLVQPDTPEVTPEIQWCILHLIWLYIVVLSIRIFNKFNSLDVFSKYYFIAYERIRTIN